MAYLRIVDKLFPKALEWGYPQTSQSLSTELSPSHMMLKNIQFHPVST